MMVSQPTNFSSNSHFSTLHPDNVINLVENSLQREFSNLFRPLNSYINRVFELEERSGKGVVVKFYRPGRWSAEAIRAEHRFLSQLTEYEIPVIAPLMLHEGTTLGIWQNMYFAVFPKCGGRSVDEFSDDQWEELGRLVGRTHAVGQLESAEDRETMLPSSTTARQIEYLRDKELVAPEVERHFFSLAVQLVQEIGTLFDGVTIQRIHGDLHFSNIIYRPGESFFLIDFDDMVMGPQVQDIWMLLLRYGEDSLVELDLFLEGYEQFCQFDRRSCRLIEPLRAMRYIHYLAWCGYQVVEDGRTQASPDFGSVGFWRNEAKELADQLERIRTAKNPFGYL
ncbi:MAG: serine/threonine protein kinase [Desulfopila sp.]|jgi:Ser/Thr protein kinase RdoA (MazF antagonist)|nr:serine/threonine protein kinase [Desulfopila sp.]